MQQQFIADLKAVCSKHSFTETTLANDLLFVYETQGIDEATGFAKIYTVLTNTEPEIRLLLYKLRTSLNLLFHKLNLGT